MLSQSYFYVNFFNKIKFLSFFLENLQTQAIDNIRHETIRRFSLFDFSIYFIILLLPSREAKIFAIYFVTVNI